MTGIRETENLNLIQNTRWRKLVDVTWVILFGVAICILIASLPGYLHYLANIQFNTVDASPFFVKTMRFASLLASIGTACLSIALSAILFRRKRNEIMGVFASFFLLGHGIIMAGPLEALNGFEPGAYTSIIYAVQSALFMTPAMIFFCLFPNGRFVPHWTRFVAMASLAYIPIGLFLSPADLFNFNSPVTAFAGLGYFIFIIIGVYAQIFRYRHISTLQERQQTKGFVFGMLVWLAFSVLISIPYVILQNLPAGVLQPWWSPLSQLGWFTSLMLLPLSFSIAIMRYRLWDIDPVINRTLVYGALTLSTMAIYVLIVGFVGNLLQSDARSGLAFLTTGLVALIFQPLRLWLQRLVNRQLYGDRDNPAEVLANLGRRLESVVAPEAILPAVVESVSTALRLPYVAVMLKEGLEFALAAECGKKPASDLTCELFPLNYQAESIGQIIVSKRAGEESLTSDEKTLLQNIARQVGVAVYAIQVTRDLQRSRERIVAAREEERRRLRRDLHDGLGPTLASLTLKLDAARNQLKQNPIETDALLIELKSQTQSSIEDIRRLVYNLRPPALDELGLLSAIREYAASHLRPGLSVQIECKGDFQKFPAAVEVAAYRIICEALTNVSKHSQATECDVRLMFNGALQIDIQDNGIGLPLEMHSGVGTFSMRERAVELGGTFSIQSSANGVHVSAHLPCEVSSDEP